MTKRDGEKENGDMKVYGMILTIIIFTSSAITQVDIRCLPTAEVRGSRPGHRMGFCGRQSGAGAGVLKK
jgi:hypothetical protein